MKIITTTITILTAVLTAVALSTATAQDAEFEKSVEDYIKKFPYQDTYNYAMIYTGGDPARFNTLFDLAPVLLKAGDDKVVRMNNDTYYTGAIMLLGQGPVTLGSTHPSEERFNSFQLMDDRNVNFRNLIHPSGTYTLYYGDKPDAIEGEAVEAPSSLVVVIVRVEVRDKNDAKDVAEAKKVFDGITVSGPAVTQVAKLDLLSGFDKKVEEEALRRMDEVFATTDVSELVAGPGDVPDKVSYLQLAAGTKGGWGGPVTSHSAYESFFTDNKGEQLTGEKGTYTITTEEPPVEAFWSITVYDTERGGYLHPNDDDRYHINNTGAVKNDDGTVTFTFKQKCEEGDLNCLEVPAGQFDLVARYYLAKEPIRSGKWRMSKPVLQKK